MCESVNELRCILYWSHIGPIRHVCIRCQWWYFEILDIVCPLYICWLIQSHLWYSVTGHKSLGMMGGGINNTLEHDTEGVKSALKASCPFLPSIHLWYEWRWGLCLQSLWNFYHALTGMFLWIILNQILVCHVDHIWIQEATEDDKSRNGRFPCCLISNSKHSRIPTLEVTGTSHSQPHLHNSPHQHCHVALHQQCDFYISSLLWTLSDGDI